MTPNKLIYKVLTGRGTEIFRSAPYTGLKDCVLGYNTTHSRGAKISYDKAYRTMRNFGVHSEVIKGTVTAGSLAEETLIVIICSATPEPSTQMPATQQYNLNEREGLFVPVQTLAELGTLAHSINQGKTKAALTAAQAICKGHELYNTFLIEWATTVGATHGYLAHLASQPASHPAAQH